MTQNKKIPPYNLSHLVILRLMKMAVSRLLPIFLFSVQQDYAVMSVYIILADILSRQHQTS